MQIGGLSPRVSCIIILWVNAGYVFCKDTYCAYSKLSVVKFSPLEKSSDYDGDEPISMGELLDGNTTEKCNPKSKYCYSLWQEDFSNKNVTVVLAQGCWEIAAEFDCSEGECISNKPPKALNNTKFCCCIGNMCNANISDGYLSYEDDEAAARPVEHASYDMQTVIIAVTIMCSLAAVFMVASCVTYHLCSTPSKSSLDSVHLMEAPLPSSPSFNLDSLKILESIGRGRYGSVFHGTLNNESVAVKIFSSQSRQYYLNERSIYCLPFMDHPCLPKIFGAEERVGADDRPEYLLVLSYAPKGCLQDYLASNTIDWFSFCKMAQTITQGLAHLHTEVKKNGKIKMCIAHRDLTSRNILVKDDGSCMVCDFGFAICISGSKYCVNGEEQVAEATSLTDVGTLRYMAPEVLEGAVNLRDCESSLKQIDIYALGLIIWETAMRCTDLFQGVEVPEYKQPFVAEIGPHPTMEQMQVLVARHKARPLFPDIWKDTNPAVRALKETIEDCWDQDAEARLTALCVQERLFEIPIQWERHKAGSTILGVSPTVNPTVALPVPTSSVSVQSSANSCKTTTLEMPVMRPMSDSVSPNAGGSRHSGDGISTLSDLTAETSITLSPCELTPRSCPSSSCSNSYNIKNLTANNVSTSCPKVTVPLQPYQGKNPTMERNLIMDDAEEVAISGNSLVEKGGKYNGGGRFPRDLNVESDLFNALQPMENSESNALVPNDVLNHSVRACNPIPYVQNAVHCVATMPKQPNVPGNGHSLLDSSAKDSQSTKTGKKKNSEEGFMASLKNFFRVPRASHEKQPETEKEPTYANSNVPLPSVNVPKVPRPGEVGTESVNTHLKPKQSLETEVFLMESQDDYGMTQTVVRPVANKQIYSQVSASDPDAIPPAFSSAGNRTSVLLNGFVPSQTHPLLCLESKTSSNCNGFFSADSSEKMKRPNTLPVTKTRNANSYLLDIGNDKILASAVEQQSVDSRNADQSDHSTVENASAIEKSSPKQVNSGRFSLYDDRMMTEDLESNETQGAQAPQTSVSVSMNMNSASKVEDGNDDAPERQHLLGLHRKEETYFHD